jgi:hypothetical protein
MDMLNIRDPHADPVDVFARRHQLRRCEVEEPARWGMNAPA